MIRHFLRLNDPLTPVYRVDYDAGTWELVSSRLGRFDASGSITGDPAKDFPPAGFREVWPKPDGGDGFARFALTNPDHERQPDLLAAAPAPMDGEPA